MALSLYSISPSFLTALLLSFLIRTALGYYFSYGQPSKTFTLTFGDDAPPHCRGQPVRIDLNTRYLGCYNYSRTDDFRGRIDRRRFPPIDELLAEGLVYIDTPHFQQYQVLQRQGVDSGKKPSAGYPLRVGPPRRTLLTYIKGAPGDEYLNAHRAYIQLFEEPYYCLLGGRLYYNQLRDYLRLFGNVPKEQWPPHCDRHGGSKNFALKWKYVD